MVVVVKVPKNPPAGLSNSFQTLFSLMHCLPVAPSKGLSAEKLAELLLSRFGITQSVRSVQRHLLNINESYDLECHTDARDFRTKLWRWKIDADVPMIPNHGAPVRNLLSHLAAMHFPYVLPTELFQVRPAEADASAWLEKVAVVHESLLRVVPEVDPKVYCTLARALQNDCQLKISYLDEMGMRKRDQQVSLLGLIQRGAVGYGVYRVSSQDLHLIPLYRIRSAVLLDGVAAERGDFSLAAYIEAGYADFGHGQKVRVHLRFSQQQGEHLEETKLSDDQIFTAVGPDTVEVKATVNDVPSFDAWLRSFGDAVEVLERQLVS